MKPPLSNRGGAETEPAAFRRLCVETVRTSKERYGRKPAAFRRLCVETNYRKPTIKLVFQPPSGGCVLKPKRVGRL